ncbi:transcriptional regulator [secondary endosymbiont of Heteropsylla cubana]|uniref:Transcriptional regulator n=1 Tax=secondary endosymbiont of Heteropsylla cubana TaxID=134287 RepID=J3VUJ5_9ENTR|nr:transcriptional regulator [secondary endosymbiont of Heteropsylla cubana]
MIEKEKTKRNRCEEILQALVKMLKSSNGSQRITTAKLAANVGVSESALYCHFPNKSRMFDILIEFIEESLITRINLILQDEKDTQHRLRRILLLLLAFAERNPDLTRIMVVMRLCLNKKIDFKIGLIIFLSVLKYNYVKYSASRNYVKVEL